VDRALEKIKAMSLAEKLISGGGVLMLIASFFDWWHYNAADELGGEFGELAEAFGASTSVGYSGWGDPGAIWSVLAILICIALAALVIAVKVGDLQMPALPENLTWGKVFGGAAVAIVVFMLLKLWRIMDAPVGGFGIGFFIALVAAAAVIYGCYLVYSEEKAGVIRR
jgi:hypothetical protein